MKVFRGIVAAALMAAGPFTAGAMAQEQLERTSFVLGTPVTASTFVPLYLAEQEGYFADEGLDVEIVAFNGGGDLVRGMVAGAVDIGVGALAEVLLAVEAGQDIRAFYGGFNMSLFAWFGVEGVDSIEDAHGKRFGVTSFGSSTDFLTRYILAANGLDPQTDVQIIPGGRAGARLAAMDAGQLDVNIFSAVEKFIAMDRGYKQLYSQRDISAEYPNHAFYARLPLIEENPEAMKAFLRAFVHGVRLAKANPELAAQVIAERSGVEDQYALSTYNDFIDDIHEDGRLPTEENMDMFWQLGIESGAYTEAWDEERWLVRTYMDSYEDWKPE